MNAYGNVYIDYFLLGMMFASYIEESLLSVSYCSESEAVSLKGSLSKLQGQITQLNAERDELLGKIEAGDGAANTAIQQMKLQNVIIFSNIYFV